MRLISTRATRYDGIMKRLILVAVVLTAAASVHSTRGSQGSPPSLSGVWHGQYFYPERDDKGQAFPKRAPVQFGARIVEDGGRFTGDIVEPNTFGEDTSSHLRADIVEGRVSPDGGVRFTKRYDGTAGVGHDVGYSGRLIDDGVSIKGRWETGGVTGAFVMGRVRTRRPQGEESAVGRELQPGGRD